MNQIVNEKRVALWSCGGGRQSAGIAALIVRGRLPKPDHACMVALEWERRATYRYVCDYVRPAMLRVGVPFTFVSRKKYARVGFWSGEDGASLTLPAFSDRSGSQSKLPEFCSNEWKRRVVTRWASEMPGWKKRGVDCWVGISWDERHRRRAPATAWFAPAYPLLDMLPKMLPVAACLDAVREIGWPEPPRSRCTHCPNQTDAEWAELTPEEWESACRRDEWVRETDPNAYLHRKMIPLRQVVLEPKAEEGFFGGCQAGTCY